MGKFFSETRERYCNSDGDNNGSDGKIYPRTDPEVTDGDEMYNSSLSLTSTLDGVGWLKPRPGCFTSGNGLVPTVQVTGWAPRPVWTGKENLATTGFRSPDRPARSKLLYRLSYSVPLKTAKLTDKLCVR